MAANAFANVMGAIFRLEHREGIGKKSNAPYSMDILHVLVPNGGLTEVVLPETLPVALYGEGQEVDFTVEIRRNEYGFGLSVVRDNVLGDSVASSAASHAA